MFNNLNVYLIDISTNIYRHIMYRIQFKINKQFYIFMFT